MKKKLTLIVPLVLLLVVGGGAYKFVFAKKEEEPKVKVKGTVYVLSKEFLVNLADGRFAKLTVALVLDPHDTSTAKAGGSNHNVPPAPPEGFGPMAQEAIVRDLVTDSLTGTNDRDLIDPQSREELKKKVLKAITKSTDVHADEILFTDVTVQ